MASKCENVINVGQYFLGHSRTQSPSYARRDQKESTSKIEKMTYHQFERVYNYLFSAGSLEHMSKRVEHE
jgi:hypothetical protein